MDRSGYCHPKFNKPDSKILHVYFYAESEFLCEDSCMCVWYVYIDIYVYDKWLQEEFLMEGKA